MDGDAAVVESGGKTDFPYGQDRAINFRPKVDRVPHDGDTVKPGETVLTAPLRAGHITGTTTWTFDEMDGEKPVHVVIVV